MTETATTMTPDPEDLAQAAAAANTVPMLRAFARAHGVPVGNAMPKRDVAWHLAARGLVDESGNLRDTPTGTPR